MRSAQSVYVLVELLFLSATTQSRPIKLPCFFCIFETGEYYLPMLTPGFRRTLEAGFWFVVGFVAHWILVHFHNHP